MMEVIAKIVSAAMVSVFVQNAIFDRAFGSNVGIYASRKNSTVIGFTLGITAMTTLASFGWRSASLQSRSRPQAQILSRPKTQSTQ